MKKRTRHSRKETASDGVAAIEFVLVLPVLITLFIMVANLSQYITMNRRLAIAANLVTDLVTRNKTLTGTDITDYFAAAVLSLRPADTSRLRVDVYNFRQSTGITGWTKSTTTGTACTPPVSTKYTDLLATTDVIVTVVCMPFVPPMNSAFLGQNFYTIFPPLRQEVVMRPRQTVALNCTANCP